MFPRLVAVVVALALAVSACGADPEPSVGDLVPVQGFGLVVGSDGSNRVAWDEASHLLYFRPLDEVLDRRLFKDASPEEDVAFELLSSDGTVLESHSVYSWDICADPYGCYTQWQAVFEHPPDFDAFRFVEGSRLVYEGQRSPNAPEVSFVGLEQGQVFAGGVDVEFQLLIDDKDDDDLLPRMLLSVDGGPYESTYGTLIHSELLHLWVPIIRSWALTRGFSLHPGTRNRYEIRYTRTQHRPASRQVNDHGRVSGTHRQRCAAPCVVFVAVVGGWSGAKSVTFRSTRNSCGRAVCVRVPFPR